VVRPAGRRVGAILSGGNMDGSLAADLLAPPGDSCHAKDPA
jgi:hypothetical protein